MKIKLKVNGEELEADVESGTPLLWVLRDHLNLTGTKFGCGAVQCGACSVLVGKERVFSCVTPVDALEGVEISTIESLDNHPIQKAWVDERVPQCGYCQPGMIMNALALLNKNSDPTTEDITEHMNNICRCGTYPRVIKAIKQTAKLLKDGEKPNA
jgi:isoquinoline 1-oxidoreductase alpha subunit